MNERRVTLLNIFAEAASYFLARRSARIAPDQCRWTHLYEEKLGEANAILWNVPDREVLPLLDSFFDNDDTPRVILVFLYRHLAARFAAASVGA